MTNYMKWGLCLSVTVSLAGCLGGGSGGGGSDGGGSGPRTFAQQITLADQLADEIEVLNEVDPMSFQTMGSTTYNGNLGMSLAPGTPDAIVLYGDLRMTLEFGTDTISGAVSNVVDSDDAQYGGQFQLENGDIDRMASTDALTADLTGDITAPDSTILTADATLAGDVFGDNESHVAGAVSGNIIVDGSAVGISSGAFAGRR